MNRKLIPLLTIPLAVALVAGAAHHEKKRVSLFNGKNLDGWKVITCDIKVDNGEILLVDGNGLLQTDKKYGDFVLEFECKALNKEMWDSGVYFRYDTIPEGRPWPKQWQVNLRKGQEGHVGGIEGAKSEGQSKDGEWNKYTLTVKGSTLALEINGKKAWKADGLGEPKVGYIAIQAEVPMGGQYRFRNVYITEL